MRACARDTAFRLCVRAVVCWSAFSLVPPLRSTPPSTTRAASFGGFPATMGESDFSGSFIIGFGLRPSRCGPRRSLKGRSGEIPVPGQKASAHARGYDGAGSAHVSRYRHAPCCLLLDGKHRHPVVVLRRLLLGNSARRWLGDFTKLLPKVLRLQLHLGGPGQMARRPEDGARPWRALRIDAFQRELN